MDQTSKQTKKKAQVKKTSGSESAGTRRRKSKQLEATVPDSSQNEYGVRNLERDDMESYLRLRQVLDSFHAKAIYYYASGKNAQDRTARQEQVKEYLESFSQEMSKASRMIPMYQDCPPGTRQCPGGDCIAVSQPCV